MKDEYFNFLEAAIDFLSEDPISKATSGRYSWDEPIEVSHYEVDRMRKNKDNSVSFYNGRERIKRIEIEEDN